MLSLLITSLLGLFCCSGVNFNSLDHTKEIETHEIQSKKSFTVNQYDFYSFVDLTTPDAFYNYVAYLSQLTNTDIYGVTASGGFNYTLYTQDHLRLFESYDLTLSGIQNNTGLFFVCDYIGFHADPVTVTRSSPAVNSYQRFYLEFHKKDTNNFLRLRFVLITNNNLASSRNWYTDAIYYLNSGAVVDYSAVLTVLCEYQLVGWMRSFLPYQLNSETSLETAFNSGIQQGYASGYSAGRQVGYNQGYEEGSTGDPVATSIFNGIVEIGLLPVNVFLSLFDFEVFGINISGLVSALLTVTIVMIILRFLFNGKSGDK